MAHHWLGCIALAVALSGAAGGLRAQDQDHTVPFVTSRNLAVSDGPGTVFGDERSGLSAGHCQVQAVDVGGLEPVVANAPAFLREQLLRIDQVSVLEPSQPLDALLTQVAPASPAVFVHGYFIDFDKGCRRAALLQANAGLADRLLWFSWPSDGDVANYTRDEADLYWSVLDLAEIILALDRSSETVAPVDVIGHSLGGRGVVLALYEIAHRHPDIRLGHVVLLAPDMDFGIFARLLPRIAPIAESITVYTSDEDRPLALSEQLHGYPRLGQAGNDVSVLQGVEVIDLSDIPNESASGHLYHIHNPLAGADLDRLLNEGLRATDRPGLLQTGPNSWSVQD